MKNVLLTFGYVTVLAFVVYLADRQDSAYIFDWIRAIPGGDKVGHLLLMGGFSFIVNYSFKCFRVSLAGRKLLLGSLLVTLVVVAEELSQLFIPSRTFDVLDLMFDVLGIWLFGRLAVGAVNTSQATIPARQ